MKASKKHIVPMAVMLCAAALVYGNEKGAGISQMFQAGPGGATVTWETDSSDTQILQRTDALTGEPVWVDVETLIVPDQTNTVTDTDTFPAAFYRIISP